MTTLRILILTTFLSLAACGGGESNTDTPSSSSDAPVVTQANAESGSPTPPAGPHPGEKIYEQYCFSCHTPGLSGAPKLGDKEAWAPRIAKGQALLLATTIEGIVPAMPAKGLCMSCTDEELAQVVDFMVQKSQ